MKRVVRSELLDMLPPADPRAIRSRRDLRRVNALMRHHTILTRALRTNANGCPLRSLLEIGAGDGQFLLRVARKLSQYWPAVSVTLLDRRETVAESTLAEFAALGWDAQTFIRDIRDWTESENSPVDVIVANLFLHHFSERELMRLLRTIAARTCVFVAVEPRRSTFPLFCSRLLWMIGCNSVTSYDAPVSVHAGFKGRELSALWPQSDAWELMETNAGAFSHLFTARRKE
jgi:hypothetical protein